MSISVPILITSLQDPYHKRMILTYDGKILELSDKDLFFGRWFEIDDKIYHIYDYRFFYDDLPGKSEDLSDIMKVIYNEAKDLIKMIMPHCDCIVKMHNSRDKPLSEIIFSDRVRIPGKREVSNSIEYIRIEKIKQNPKLLFEKKNMNSFFINKMKREFFEESVKDSNKKRHTSGILIKCPSGENLLGKLEYLDEIERISLYDDKDNLIPKGSINPTFLKYIIMIANNFYLRIPRDLVAENLILEEEVKKLFEKKESEAIKQNEYLKAKIDEMASQISFLVSSLKKN